MCVCLCVCILFQARALGQITYDQPGRLETGYARFKNAPAVTLTHTHKTHSLTQSLISVFDASGELFCIKDPGTKKQTTLAFRKDS